MFVSGLDQFLTILEFVIGVDTFCSNRTGHFAKGSAQGPVEGIG